jgi:putative Mg2+ transporter-C (MgtC) family protein
MEDSYYQLLGFALYVPWYAKQLMMSAIVGLCIGVERELRGKPASLRTFSVISTGSCLFTILSVQAAGTSVDGSPYDVTRIAAQIVSGIGFLGGGVIFKTTDRIEGITTGALIWLAAALGMACGFNQTGPFFWACVVGIQVHLVIYVLYELIYFIRERKETKISPNNT